MRVIYCAGEQGRVVRDILRTASIREEVVFADDDAALHGTTVDETTVIGGFKKVTELDSAQCLVAFGDQQSVRLQIAGKLASAGIGFFNAVHATATVSSTGSIGDGVTINGQSYVGPGAELDDHVLVDSGVSISHDSTIAWGATVTPGATLAGGVKLGKDVYVGPGATILEDITIGESAVIGAGSVVTEDVSSGTTVVGSPAEPIE